MNGVPGAATLAAGRHSVVLNEGCVFMFGSNASGQLGFDLDTVGRVVGVPRMLEVVLSSECTWSRCVNEDDRW